MRLKYYLRGLGLGILVSTLFLMLSIQLHGGIMTDERVIARAKELGMVIPDDGETDTPPLESESTQPDDAAQNDAQPDDAAQDDTAQDNTQTDDTTSDGSVQNDGTQDGITPENAAQGDDAQNDTTSEDAAQGDAAQNGVAQDDAQGDIIFTVADGEVCRTAAEKLLACGLIEDVDAFRKYMSAHDYDGLIREGTYRIPVGADADTIAKIITAQVPEAVVVEDTETTDSQ